MTKKLTFRETIFVASMLFGMFFGAGNLIFPVSMGQMAGSHIWQAAAGFLITGVGLPLLGVAALGISRETGLLGLGSRVGSALPDDRAIFCHTQMRQCLLYCGDGRHTCGGGELPFSGSVFLYFLCSGPVFCPQAGADHDMDRESAEPSLSCISCRPCGAGTDCAHGWCP